MQATSLPDTALSFSLILKESPPMKFLLSTSLLVFMSFATVLAGNVPLPRDGAMKLVVTLPDTWKSSVDEDGVLNAESPDEELGLAAWAVDKAELGDIHDAHDKLERIFRDCVKNIRLTAVPRRGVFGTIKTTVFEGTGIDVDDDEPVQFRAIVLVGGPQDVVVLYAGADNDVQRIRLAILDQIIRSVRPE